MIEIRNAVKSFEEVRAIKDLSMKIRDGEVFGLVGTNGAGKSTLLRMVAGIIRPDAGQILSDGTPVYEHEEIKKEFFYISDEGYVFANAVPLDMMRFYEAVYPRFQEERFHEMMQRFGLEEKRKISTFSKGMKKQLSLIFGLCSGTRYLLCDETFDGLDPVMREAFRKTISEETWDRGMMTVLAGHNQQEMEDICDQVGFLHEGRLLTVGDMDEVVSEIFRVQFATREPVAEESLSALRPLRTQRQGRLCVLTLRGDQEEALRMIQGFAPEFCETLPLSLEEVFILEMEEQGYAK